MTVKKLISLVFRHTFFQGGIAEQLMIAATEACQQHLKNYRLQARYSDHGFELYSPSSNPSLEHLPTEGLTLDFRVVSSNPYFKDFTEFPIGDKHQIPTYVNWLSMSNPMELGTSSPSDWLLSQSFQDIAGVSLKLNASVLSEPENNYTVQWKSNSQTWKYYYIGQSNFPAPEISHSELTFDRQEAIKDNATYVEDGLARKLVNQYPEAKHWVFTSQLPVQWKAARYPQIQLLRDHEVIDENLPNPSLAQRGIHIINALNS